MGDIVRYNITNNDNINTYKTYTNYDYDRFKNLNATIKFYRIEIDKDYENVVGWESKAQFDDYFNTSDLYVQADLMPLLKQLDNFSVMTGRTTGHIRVQIPYASCISFNYIMITTPELPIEFYKVLPNRQKLFFFVLGLKQIAGNNTEITLELDAWNTNYFDYRIKDCLFQEGHYPCNKITPQQFISNRLNNVKYILDSEDTEVITNRCDSQTIVNFQSSENWAIIAFNSDPNSYSEGTEMMRYDNCDLDVDSGHTGLNHRGNETHDFNYLTIHPLTYNSTKTTRYLAIDYSQIETLVENAPTLFLDSIIQVYLIPKSLVNVTTSYNYFGVTFYELRTYDATVYNFSLGVNDFNIPDIYKNFTKLYTSPYFMIRISNLDAEYFVKIQDFQTLNIITKLCIEYPVINLIAFVEGVQGNTRTTIVTIDRDRATTHSISNSLYNKYQFQMDIHGMSLSWTTNKSNSSERHRVDIINQIKQEYVWQVLEDVPQQLSLEWHNAYNSLEIAKENGDRSNINRLNTSNLSANTNKTNADIDNNANFQIAQNNANTERTIKMNTANNDATIARNNANTDKTTTDKTTNTTYDISERNRLARSRKTNLDKTYRTQDSTIDITYLVQRAGASRDWAVWEIAYDIARSAIGGDITGIGLTALVAAAGLARGVAINNKIMRDLDIDIARIQSKTQATLNLITQTQGIDSNTDSQNNNDTKNTQLENAQTVLTNTLTNIALRLNTLITNANTAYSNAISNANIKRTANNNISSNTLSTSLSNNQSNFNTDATNLTRSMELSQDIADTNRALGMSKMILTESKILIEKLYDYLTLYYQAPKILNASGTPNINGNKNVIGENIIQIQLQSCDISQLSEMGDKFIRYGYKYHKIIEFTGFHSMTKFSYWKVDYIHILADTVNESSQTLLRRAFREGVTIWRNPSDIGNINLYENQPLY